MKLSKYDQLISLILKFFFEISRKKKNSFISTDFNISLI